MPAQLKGSAKIKLETDYKAGDEIDVKDIVFEADQADFERSLRERLAQQKRQHEQEKQTLEKQIEDLKSGAPKPDEQTLIKLTRLENELAQTKLQGRIDGMLKKKELADLPDAYRATIQLKPDASDEELEAAVAAAGAAFTELKTKLGGSTTEPKKPANFGNPSTGGSRDPKDKGEELKDKVKRYRPDLHKMLEPMEPEQQLEVMQSWADQGLLKPKN